MKLEHHVVISALFAGVIYALTKSLGSAVACWTMGVFIDLDHFLEYFREFHWKVDLREFFRASYEGAYEKVWVVLHAWEWLVLLLVFLWKQDWPVIWVGLWIGWFQHMVLDQIFNKPHPLGYSILFRWSVGWSHKIAFPLSAK